MAGWWREQAKTLSRSWGWAKIRALRIKLDGGRCRVCSKAKLLQVHHIRPYRLHPELELDIDNTITLCGRCHLLIGHLDNWKSYNENVVIDAQYSANRIASRP